jgi:hypothetical protein
MTLQQTEIREIGKQRRSSWFLCITSFTFILLQSACTAVIAVSGLRLLIGLTSLAAASIIPGFIFSIHAEQIRLPMMIVAVLGSVVNLYVVWRIRSLRSRPAAQWRMRPATSSQRRSETVQITLSILTLALVMIESVNHHHLHGSF